MRWMSFDVDYEMCGKDLTESVDLGSKICRALNKKPPTNLIYEMFLDEKGEKFLSQSAMVLVLMSGYVMPLLKVLHSICSKNQNQQKNFTLM